MSELFHVVHDRAAIGIELVAMDGRLMDVNQKLADMLGYTREALIGRPIADLVHPDDWAREQKLLDNLLAGEIPSYTIEERYQRKDGRVIWAQTTTWLVRDAQPPHRIVVLEDITEGVQARQRIEELGTVAEQSRAQLEAVISSMSDGLSIYDPQGHLVLASRAGLAMLGYSSLEEAPKDLARYPEIFELSDLSGRLLLLAEWPISRALRGEVFSNVEISVRRKDIGLARIGSFSGGPVRDARGEIIWGVITAQDVTERHAIEMERARLLKESRQLAQKLEAQNVELAHAREMAETEQRRYRELFEFAPDGYIVTDEHGIIHEANSAAGEVLGVPADQLVGDRLENYVAREQFASFEALLEHLEKAKRVNDWEFLLQPRDGEPFPASVTVATVREAFTETCNRRWSIHDIRQRAEAEKAVREAEDRFRSVLENTRDGVQRLDLSTGKYDLISPSMETITGFTPDELREMSQEDVAARVHPDDREAYRRYIREAQTDSENVHQPVEYRWKAKDGTYRWLSCSLRAARDEQGRAVAVVAATRDITERKEAEQAVRESETRLREVLENSQDAIYRFGLLKGRHEYISPAIETITGYTPEEMLQMTYRDLLADIHPEDRSAFIAHSEAMEQSEAEHPTDRMDYRWRAKSGEYRWLSISRTLVRDRNGKPIAHVGSVREITEQKEAEQALQESEARLREVLENAQDIIYRIDLVTDRLEYVSAVSERITGYLRERLLNMTRQDIISLLHPDDQPVYLARTELLLHSAEERPKDRADYRWKVGEGVYHWFDLGRTLIRDDEGRPRALVISARDITEQKEAELALRDSERKLRNLIDYSADGISLLDESGQVIEWNPALERITGIPKEQVLGRRMWNMLAELQLERAEMEPRMRERMQGQIMTFLQTGQGDWLSRIVEGDIERPDGTRRSLQVTMFPIQTEHGWQVGSVARDVTEQKKAEQALRESEARLRDVLENSRDAIYRYDVRAERYEYFSSAIQDISGYAPEELLQMDCEELLEQIHPEDRPALVAHNEALLRSDQERPKDQVEYRWKSRSGKYCWMSIQRVLIRDDRGQPVAHVGAIRDITERKEAEQALAESEARLREVLMNSQDAIYRFNIKTKSYDFYSPSSETLTGFSEQEMAGLGLEKVMMRTHPDDRAAVACRLQEELQQPDAVRPPMEYRWQAKNGEWRWFSDSRRVITDEQGQPVALVVVSRDITEQRQAEDVIRQSEARLKELTDTLEQRVAERTIQLRALAAELSRAEERERRRLARVLHDHLQQLLVAARLNVSTLQRRLVDTPLHQTTEQLDQVLGEAIDTSRSLTAELSPPVLYDAGLTPALHWLSRWMQEKHSLLVDVDAEDLGNRTSEGVRAMLFQAARELLFNVVKHAGVNRAAVRLRQLAGDELELVVSDQGAGFDPSQVGRAEEGGFGLFSIQERLEMVGGRMQVQSALGQGTRVTLRVPMYPLATEAATVAAEEAVGRLTRVSEAEERASVQAAAITGERSIRVLLADDHIIVRQGLARLLQDEPGIELVGEADDGREALALTRLVHPDVVLMDVSMPVMDGVEATQRILADQPDVRVIGLSMYEGDEMAERMRQAGAVDYVPKGGDPAMLVRAVRRSTEKVPA